MTYRALLIGVANYEDLPRLAGPIREVKLVAEALAEAQRHPLDRSAIEVLLDPTFALAQESLATLLDRAGSEDTLLVYFSGHAIYRDDQLFLLLANSNDRGLLTAISEQSIRAALEATRAAAVLLILNTSFAGAFSLPDSPRLKDSFTSYYLIASAGPTEASYDGDPAPFASAVAEGLREGVAFKGETLQADLLFHYVSEWLIERAWGERTRPFYASRGRLASSKPVANIHPTVRGAHTPLIFISYAHADKVWLRKLRPHLDALIKDVAEVAYWDDTKIRPRDDWHEEIAEKLSGARAAVLLVSADFLASEFIRNAELPALISQAERRKTRLYCLIVRPCRFDRVGVLSKFQAVNGPRKTLSEMRVPEQERTFLRLTDQLEQALS